MSPIALSLLTVTSWTAAPAPVAAACPPPLAMIVAGPALASTVPSLSTPPPMPRPAPGMDWFDAACHTFGTVATAGFSTYNDSIGHFRSPLIQYIIIFFMLICGISFALHYRALSGQARSYLKTSELRFYLSLVLCATLIIYVSRVGERLPLEQDIRECLFQVVSIITTTGYGTADFELWKPIAQIVLLGLMLVCSTISRRPEGRGATPAAARIARAMS